MRIRRKTTGWNQSNLASHASPQTSALGRVEPGDGVPNLRTVERIAATLNVRLSLLIHDYFAD